MTIQLLFNNKIIGVDIDNSLSFINTLNGSRDTLIPKHITVYPYIIFFKGNNYEELIFMNLNEISDIISFKNNIIKDITNIIMNYTLYSYENNLYLGKKGSEKSKKIYKLSYITSEVEECDYTEKIISKLNLLTDKEYFKLSDFDSKEIDEFNTYFKDSTYNIDYNNSGKYLKSFVVIGNYITWVNKYKYIVKILYGKYDNSLNILYFR